MLHGLVFEWTVKMSRDRIVFLYALISNDNIKWFIAGYMKLHTMKKTHGGLSFIISPCVFLLGDDIGG